MKTTLFIFIAFVASASATFAQTSVDKALGALRGNQIVGFSEYMRGIHLDTSVLIRDAKAVDVSTDPNYGIMFVEGKALAKKTSDDVLHIVSEELDIGRFFVHVVPERALKRSGRPFGLWVAEFQRNEAEWINIKIPQAAIYAGGAPSLTIDERRFWIRFEDGVIGDSESRGSEPAYFLIICDECNTPIAAARFTPYEFSYIKE